MAGRFPHTQEASPDCAGASAAFATLRAAIVHHQYGRLVAEHGEVLSPALVWNVRQGANLSAAAVLQAEATRSRVYAAAIDFFTRHDALLTPAASVVPFPNTQDEVLLIDGKALHSVIDYPAITFVVSLLGLPCLSIPCGSTAEGLPCGLQVIVPPFQEGRRLGFARRLEQDLVCRHRWPDSCQAAE